MLVLHVSEGVVFPGDILLLLARPRNSRQTSDLQLPQPEQPDGPDPPTLKTTFLSSAGCLKNHAVLLGAPSMNEACHHNASRTPMWCRQRKAVHHHFQTAVVGGEHGGVQVFHQTVRAASSPPFKYEMQHFRERTPFLPNTPDLAHAARWWPNESIGRRRRGRMTRAR